MLNISPNTITGKVLIQKYSSLYKVESRKSGRVLLRLTATLFAIFFISLFLPWTQNIRSGGQITTLKPDQRPQTIHSIIPGRIENWYVQEGDYVDMGDTILLISEVKDEYFDPELIPRTEDQLTSKQFAVQSYEEKVKALKSQIVALKQTQELKLEQAQNKLKQARLKVISDSIDYEAAIINYQIAQEQYKRFEELYKEDLRSKTDLENRRMSMQKALAEKISAENQLLASRNELINARVEITSIQAQYRDDIAKAQSEKFTALSSKFDAEATVTKLRNQLTNYTVRSGMYYITAPQDGYITKALQSGIGETIKEGTEIISIMPARWDLAVEMYIQPMDLPLVKKGQDVQIQFDGWPAIVFAGWPNISYGTYGGEVYAIDNFISENGKYRVLVAPDPEEQPWPDALRVGSGTTNLLLLKDVSIGYELWRQLNGFPPDYYQRDEETAKVN